MVDGNVWVQWMMGDAVHRWCAAVVWCKRCSKWQPDSWQAPPPPHERLPEASHEAQSRRAVERRWNRGRERRARSMWGKWDSRDVKGHWVDRCGVTRLWQVSGSDSGRSAEAWDDSGRSAEAWGDSGRSGTHQGGADETGTHQGGAEETGAHQGGADETPGSDWDLEETETQEAERAQSQGPRQGV